MDCGCCCSSFLLFSANQPISIQLHSSDDTSCAPPPLGTGVSACKPKAHVEIRALALFRLNTRSSRSTFTGFSLEVQRCFFSLTNATLQSRNHGRTFSGLPYSFSFFDMDHSSCQLGEWSVQPFWLRGWFSAYFPSKNTWYLNHRHSVLICQFIC